jgi:hypothetical protein
LTRHKTRRRGALLALACSLALLTTQGCDTLKEQAGLTKRAPDEFTVVTKAPLVMPPDFTLRPPKPGAKRPQEVQPTSKARSVVLNSAGVQRTTSAQAAQSARTALAAGREPQAAANGEPSGAEHTLLSKAGALDSDSSIREVVNRETTLLAEKDSSFADRLIFWQKKPPFGSTLDAEKESQRLREAAAKGESPDSGETPVIRRRQRGILEGIFY